MLGIAGVRSDVEENLLARQHARPAVIEAHLERLRRHKTPCPHDQFGAARLVVLQVRGNLALDHVALALADRRHVDGDGTDHRAELRGVAHQMRDLSRSKSRSCWAGRRYWDRSPRSIAAPPRPSVAPIAPDATPEACRPRHCRGSGFHTVPVETCASSIGQSICGKL